MEDMTGKTYSIAALLIGLATVFGFLWNFGGEPDVPDAAKTTPAQEQEGKMEEREIAVLAGGCFWCLDAVYRELKGVEKVVSGYSNGFVVNPTYKQVCTGDTGHAEVVQITFDPKVITYKELLEVFFTIHDPTTLNRQGNDVGTQYRSGIFYNSPEQKKIALETMKEIKEAKIWRDPIVTEITEAETFYPAEDYHQNYYANNPQQGYCQVIIEPKVSKFRKKFLSKLRKESH